MSEAGSEPRGEAKRADDSYGSDVSGAWGTNMRPQVRLADLPAARVAWHATLPSMPGQVLTEHSVGPVLVPASGEDAAMVVLASSAIGFVAVDAATGVLRWQRLGEEAPEQPLVADDNHLWLSGRCMAHSAMLHGAAHATALEAAVLGCVEVVDRGGELVRRVWLHLGARDHGRAVALRGRRGRVLGLVGARLLWAYGPDVLAFDVSEGWPKQVYRAGEGTMGDVFGWLGAESEQKSELESEWKASPALHSDRTASELIIATSDALMGFDPSTVSFAPSLLWHLRVPRSVGMAGPVRTAKGLAWVRDNELQAARPTNADPAIAWTAGEYHSYAPGSLIALEHDRLLALSMADGIRPVIRDATTGRLLHRGQAAPGIQVLAVAPITGGLVAVVRLDRSLRRDAVIAWDADLRIVWAWPLPVPPRPRIVSVALAAIGRDALIFHGGRHAIRLGAP